MRVILLSVLLFGFSAAADSPPVDFEKMTLEEKEKYLKGYEAGLKEAKKILEESVKAKVSADAQNKEDATANRSTSPIDSVKEELEMPAHYDRGRFFLGGGVSTNTYETSNQLKYRAFNAFIGYDFKREEFLEHSVSLELFSRQSDSMINLPYTYKYFFTLEKFPFFVSGRAGLSYLFSRVGEANLFTPTLGGEFGVQFARLAIGVQSNYHFTGEFLTILLNGKINLF